MRSALSTIVFALTLASSAAGQTPPGGPAASTVITATASIRGRVVDRNGTAIRFAEVRVRAGTRNDIRVTSTDQNGQYEIRDLTPDTWQLRVSKAGFVTQSSSQATPLDEDKPLVLADGQRLTADVVLTRAGAIAGRVLDEFGEAAGNLTVRALRLRTVSGRQQLTPMGVPDSTDDTGAFRLHGIPPGTYYVVTTRLDVSTTALLPDDPAIYFPGTTEMQSAEAIKLGAGQEQLGVTIVMPAVTRGVTVSGRAFSATGTAAADATLHLVPRGLALGRFALGIVAHVSADGQFRIANVPPGSYTLNATVSEARPETVEHAILHVDVGPEDVTGLVLTTTRARTLRGVVVAEAGVVLPRPLAYNVALESPDRSTISFLQSMMQPTGEFVIEGVWGVYRLRTELPDGWMVKSVEVSGTEVDNRAIDFSDVPASATLRIAVTNRAGELTGTVTTKGSDADRTIRASVVVFPDDETKWGAASRFVVMARAAMDGRFRVRGLPAESRYRAIAVSYLEPDEYQDPEFLARMRERSVSFSLREGENRTLNLPLVER